MGNMKRQQGRQETIDVTEASGKTSNNICHYRKYVVLNKFEKKSKFSRCLLDFQQHFYQLEVHMCYLPIATEHVKSCGICHLPSAGSAKCRGEQERERLLVLRSIEICHLGGGRNS